MSKKTELAIVEPKDYAILKMDQESLPATLRENCGDGGFTRFDLDNVPMPTGGGLQWSVPTLEGGEEQLDAIEGVCVLFQDGRKMWETEYGEGEGGDAPPDCTSTDLVTGRGDPGGPCASCPLAVFGSGKNNSQKCKQHRTMFIIRPEAILPTVIVLPPSSLKVVRKYFMRLTANGVPFHAVITKFSLVKDKNSNGQVFSKVSLSMVKRLDEAEALSFASFNSVFKEIFKSSPVVASNTPAE